MSSSFLTIVTCVGLNILGLVFACLALATVTFAQSPTSSDATVFNPQIQSASFPDSDLWYSEKTGSFNWPLPSAVTMVAVDVSTTSGAEPQTVLNPAVSEYEFDGSDLQDGVYFFNVQFKTEERWWEIGSYQVQFDTTPPLPFAILVENVSGSDAFPRLAFMTADQTSGLAGYELNIVGQPPVFITPEEARFGYQLSELTDGSYDVTITALDRAGNRTSSNVAVNIRAGWTPPTPAEPETSNFTLTGSALLALALAVVVLALLAYIIHTHRNQKYREELLRKETREVEEQTAKIFSALRDEIYDQLQALTKTPRLSKKAKAAVDGLNQALAVSETLLEKEIEDVEDILKRK